MRSGGSASSAYTCRLCMGRVACHAPLPRTRADASDPAACAQPIRVPGRRMQEAEHDTEEPVHCHLVGEDTSARHEWRPRPASPIGVDPINTAIVGHRTRFSSSAAIRPCRQPFSAQPAERRSKECAVREMHNDADLAPRPASGEQRAEESHVRVRRSEDSLTDWRGRSPDGCSHRSRPGPSSHVRPLRCHKGR